MTEREWLACEEPSRTLYFVGTRGASLRKRRLLAVACCRRIEQLILRFKGAWRAVVLAEKRADGAAVSEEAGQLRYRLIDQAFSWVSGYQQEKENNVMYYAASAAADCLAGVEQPPGLFVLPGGGLVDVSEQAARAVGHRERRNDRDPLQMSKVRAELAAQIPLIHCVFGNPFRPVTLDPNWRTSTVVALAAGIYEERTFDRLLILADALQDAGCDNEDVLNHCLGPGPHVRGCWVIDLVLGKE